MLPGPCAVATVEVQAAEVMAASETTVMAAATRTSRRIAPHRFRLGRYLGRLLGQPLGLVPAMAPARDPAQRPVAGRDPEQRIDREGVTKEQQLPDTQSWL